MMHISLGCFKLIKSVNSLSLRKRSQSCHCADLSLSTCKHGRSMYSRDDINFCSQRTNLRDLTSIRTFVIFKDHLTNSLLLILIYGFAKNSQPFFIICKCILKSCCDLTDIFFSCLLVICKNSFFHFFRRHDLLNCFKQFFRNCTGSIQMFFFTTFSYDLVDKTDDLLVYIMCLIDCFNHSIFRNFICTGFDHDNFFSCGSNCQLKIRKFFLSQRRVDNEFTVDQTYLCSCTRSVKRNIRNAGCNRGTKHSRNLRIAFRIYRHNHVDQSYIISVILREQRTHRTVNNTGSQDCMLTCLSFSLVESSRDFAYGIHFFFVFNAQGEEIDSFSWLFGCCCCGKYSCVTIMHQGCTICLLCNTTNIYSQCSAG